ncbi:MAG: hypothetical protein FWC47_02570 [Oscillospiraceae bacterium]|nr:hypothetical protein [Oscillospiraceae bacterium]
MKKVLLIFTLIIAINMFMLKIPNAAPVLLIDKVTIDPEVVIPGKNFSIQFDLINNTSRKIENVILKVMQLEGKNTLSGFSPIGTNQVYLESIDASSKGIVKIDMIADSQLNIGAYNIIVGISYNEKDGNTEEETRLIGVVVNRPPNLLITDIDVSNKKELKFTAVNASSARIMDAIIYTYFGELEKVKYIGILEANDENEIVENIPIDASNKNIKIKIAFKDELNKEYIIEKDIIMGAKDNNVQSNMGYRANIWFFVKKIFGIGV